MTIKPKISFIICSWPAPPTLDETLASIAAQKALEESETILVNNGFSAKRALELKERFPFVHIIDEPQPGLAYARRAGFRAAQGSFFSCVDDDNVLGEGFLSALLSLVEKHPNLGCICPVIVPRWEVTPPEWIQKVGLCCLSYNSLSIPAGNSVHEQVWLNPDFNGWPMPPGGGMVIHRSSADDYLAMNDPVRLKLGHVRNSLGVGEEFDINLRFTKFKRDAAFSERLVVYHLIPEARTQMSYLLKLRFNMGRDWAVLKRLLRREQSPFGGYSVRALLLESLRSTRDWICGRLPVRLFLLELASHAGFLYGWGKDALRSRFA